MYVPAAFAETRIDLLHEFVAKHGFATLISGAGESMTASHLPVVLLRERGGRFGTLQVHLARPNEQCAALAGGEPVLAIFHGPHAYVSPRWYRNPVSVPTWNYVVVHAHGTPREMDDPALRAHLHALVAKYEPPVEGWEPGALPGDVFAKLQQQVVGFEIELTRLDGKWKLGQNRTPEDRRGAIDGLRQSGDAESAVLAEWMAARLRGE